MTISVVNTERYTGGDGLDHHSISTDGNQKLNQSAHLDGYGSRQ